MSDTIRVRVNKPIPPHGLGDVVPVPIDEHGTPLDQQWRRRLKDAETDGCCEIVEEPKPKHRPTSVDPKE